MAINARTQMETKINLSIGPGWKHQVVYNGFKAETTENGHSSMPEMPKMFPWHLPHHHPVKRDVREKDPLEVEEEEGMEETIINGLITQMSHLFSHSPLAKTHMIVQVHQTAVTTPASVT
jgi:hypothetical protein